MAFRFQSSHCESEQEASYFGGSMGGMSSYNGFQGGFGGGLGGGQMSEYSSYSSMGSAGLGMGGGNQMIGSNYEMSMGSGMGMGYQGGGGFGSNMGMREESSYYSSNNGSFGYNPCPPRF